MNKFIFCVSIIFTFSVSKFHSQQQYFGNSASNCSDSNETYLYKCNHENPSCKAFLVFIAKPPYNSVLSIANHTSSNLTELARINNVSISSDFTLNKQVIVPVSCSCAGEHYQANTSYVIRTSVDTYFEINSDTYQGLSTCNALIAQNHYGMYDLHNGLNLQVPLRCACPTQEQIGSGTKFMMTYLVSWHDSVPNISRRLNVNASSVAIANNFSNENPDLFALTTILIPLLEEPLSSQMIISLSQPNTSYSSPPQRKGLYSGIYVGVGIGAALAVACFVIILIFMYYRRKGREESAWRIEQQLPENFMDKVTDMSEILKIYSYKELEITTGKFEKRLSDNIYHGILRGKYCVIKKMTTTDVSKEIKILGNINHFNLVSLYGVCENDQHYYLVYEYLEEGCLRNWLKKENCPNSQSWNFRILMALDIANGLDYLHNFTSPAYMHKDINTLNIFLNKDLRAKIGNFSLARENGNSNTTIFAGEKGYMAPEYIDSAKVTLKADVYAFGVVLLELITGKGAVFLRDGKEIILSDCVISAMNGGGVNEMIDPRLQVKHPLGYVIDQTELSSSLLKLSVACLARQPEKRFSMAEVVSTLMKIQSDVYNYQSFSM